eukprot:6324618-Amphidinium_carterae.1
MVDDFDDTHRAQSEMRRLARLFSPPLALAMIAPNFQEKRNPGNANPGIPSRPKNTPKQQETK